MNLKATLGRNLPWLIVLALLASFSIAAASGVLADPDAPAAFAFQDQPADTEEGQSHARALSAAFREAASEVLPSVVSIINQHASISGRGSGGPAGPFEVESQGSGVVIDPSGIILTNNHVVEGASEVLVRLPDGREFRSSRVHTDPRTDLAVVILEDVSDLAAAELGDSERMEVGDWVLAIGHPFGLGETVTAGIISASHRRVGILDRGAGIGGTGREDFLQTDAAINPGNSGGPLVNLDGEVIGINTAISTRTGGNQGVGFAVPSNMARWVAQELVTEGRVRRAYLGVVIAPVNAAVAERLGVEANVGVVVAEPPIGDSPAEQAGLQERDVIVSVDGQPVNSPRELQLHIERCEIGSECRLEVIRDGERLELPVTVQELPEDRGITIKP